MNNERSKAAHEAWQFVEREKRIDRFIWRVSIGAWVVTLLVVLLFAVMTGVQVLEMWQAARRENVPWSVVVAMAIPLFVVLGGLSVLIAILSTVAMFLRLRTSSLAEIQLRLASLEDMLASQPDDRVK
jgi:predicted transporter